MLTSVQLEDHQIGADLRIVEELARRGRAVIAVCSGPTSMTAVLQAGASACLDKGVDFSDRLAEAVRAVAGPSMPASPC